MIIETNMDNYSAVSSYCLKDMMDKIVLLAKTIVIVSGRLDGIEEMISTIHSSREVSPEMGYQQQGNMNSAIMVDPQVHADTNFKLDLLAKTVVVLNGNINRVKEQVQCIVNADRLTHVETQETEEFFTYDSNKRGEPLTLHTQKSHLAPALSHSEAYPHTNTGYNSGGGMVDSSSRPVHRSCNGQCVRGNHCDTCLQNNNCSNNSILSVNMTGKDIHRKQQHTAARRGYVPPSPRVITRPQQTPPDDSIYQVMQQYMQTQHPGSNNMGIGQDYW